MTLVVTILISFIFSCFLAWRFKKNFVFFLTIVIPLVIIIEIIVTKDIAAFYYRYYYHWLFLTPLLLVIPLASIKELKKSLFVKIIFLVWGGLLITFPVMNVFNNIKSLNTDLMWFDAFSRRYALNQVGIYDFIEWQYPKTKEIIKWCESRQTMTDVYTIDPKLRYYDQERDLQIFFIRCNYRKYTIDKNKTTEKSIEEFINNHQDTYYLSLEPCHSLGSKNPFTDQEEARAYEVNQRVICSSKPVLPYLYFISKN